MKYRITIPNDFKSEPDSEALAEWCRLHEVDYPAEENIFDAADNAWPECVMVAVEDFSRICESPTPPPEDSPRWPPLWVTRWDAEAEDWVEI